MSSPTITRRAAIGTALALSLLPSPAEVRAQTCTPSGYSEFDWLLNETLDSIVHYPGEDIEGDIQRGSSSQTYWRDMSVYWREVVSPPEGEVVAFTGEILSFTTAEVMNSEGGDFFMGMLYTARNAFDEAVLRFGCTSGSLRG